MAAGAKNPEARRALAVAAGATVATGAAIVASALAWREYLRRDPQARERILQAHRTLRRGALAVADFSTPIVQAAGTQLRESGMTAARDVIDAATQELRTQALARIPASERRGFTE